MIDWIVENKEWLFGGAGIFALTALAGVIKMKKKSEETIAENSSSVTISGDANISGNVAGRDVFINTTVLESKADELISILEFRAEEIRNQLAPRYKYAVVSEYLEKFNKLHDQHVSALEESNFVLAHEILASIHELSRSLESDEFWSRHAAETPDLLYSLSLDAFQRGRLICEYVVGDMVSFSKLYPSEERMGANIDGVEKIYDRVLRSNKP